MWSRELVVSTDLEPGAPEAQGPKRFGQMRIFLSHAGLEWRSIPEPEAEVRPRVVRLPGTEDEAAWAAQEVAGFECQIRTRAAILSTRPEIYRRQLTSALARRGVEVGEARGVSAAACSYVGLLEDYLSLMLDRFPRRHLFDFLNHPRLSTGLTAEDLDGIEKWAVACDVREGLRNWSIHFPAQVSKALDGLPEDSPASASGIRPALAAFANLMCRLNIGVERRSPSRWLALLEQRLWPLLRPLPAMTPARVRRENLIMQGFVREIELLDAQYREPLALHRFGAVRESPL